MNPMAEDVLRRTAWNELRIINGTAHEVPSALIDLADAGDEASADAAYWRLDNRIVVQGQLFPAAIAVIPVILATLAGPLGRFSRMRCVDLLLQIGAGSNDVSEARNGRDLGAEARGILRSATWMFYGMALDPEKRLSEAALELAVTIDHDQEQVATLLAGLSRSDSPARYLAIELLQTGDRFKQK